MARNPNDGMITSPFGNGEGAKFFENALQKVAPELNPKFQDAMAAAKNVNAPKPETVKAVEPVVAVSAPAPKVISKAQKKLFKELTAIMVEHANLDTLDSKIGEAVFSLDSGEKIVLKML